MKKLEAVPNFPFKFKMAMHMNLGDNGGIMMYRDEERKVQAEIHTPKDKHGNWGKPRTSYMIDGDDRFFDDVHEFLRAWNEREKLNGKA